MTGPEPELIESPLNRSIEQDGQRLTVNIVRLATERDSDADAAFRATLADEGIEAFLDKD